MNGERDIVFGDLRLDPANACLWRDCQAIPLTPKVLAVLSYLVRHAGRLVTKTELLNAVWPDAIVGEAALTVCIREIRRLLGDQVKSPQFIETRHGHGYRFIAPTTVVEQPAAEPRDPVPAECGPTASPRFVGRTAELLQLQNWLDKALRGERQVVFVTGEPGIGKTTLVDAFRQRLRTHRDVWMAHGQCIEHHGSPEGYMPVLEALSQLCRHPGAEELVVLLRQRAPTWLVQLPWLLGTAEQQPSPHETLGATPERMLREIVEAVEAFTTQTPLVLILEDLHWSDYATLDLVSAVARRREPARLMLLGTYRPVEVIINDHPLHVVKQELQTHGLCRDLPLELVSESAVAEYLMLRFPGSRLPAALASLIHDRTGGNPLFMVSVIDDLVAQQILVQRAGHWKLRDPLERVEVGAPESIRLSIENQLARLSPAKQRLVEGASVAGMEFSAAAVAAALGDEVICVEERCQRLARRQQFLHAADVSEWPDGTVAGCYRFRHWLYQDVLYRRVSAARRRELHLRLGERLEAAHGVGAAAIAAELAAHFERGGDFGRAIRYLCRSAENAVRRCAHREALHCLDRAVELSDRLPEAERVHYCTAVLNQRGGLHRLRGNWVRAAEDFMTVAESAAGRNDVEVQALIEAASDLFFIDRPQCLSVADRAVERSRYIHDPLLRAHARGQLAHWNVQLRGWREEEARAFAETLDRVRRSNNGELLGLYLTLSVFHLCHQSEYRAACAAASEALPLTLAAGDAYNYMACLAFSAWARLHLGEWGELLRIIDEGLHIAQKNGLRFATTLFQFFLAWLHEQAFDFQRARDLCQPATRLEWEGNFDKFFGMIRLGMAHLGLGDRQRAGDCLHDITGWLEQGRIMDWIWHMHLHHGLSECRLAQGDLAEARRQAERMCALAAQSRERTYLALGHRTAAEIALAEGNWDEAEVEVSQALAVLQGNTLPLAEWRVYATAARLHQRRRRVAKAEQFRQQSRSVLHRLADSLGENAPLRQHLLHHIPV